MKLVGLLMVLMFIFTGCSPKVLMPYEETPLCDCGNGVGYCGSVSDVFKYVKDNEQ